MNTLPTCLSAILDFVEAVCCLAAPASGAAGVAQAVLGAVAGLARAAECTGSTTIRGCEGNMQHTAAFQPTVRLGMVA